MDKIDFVKEDPTYKASAGPELIKVPPMQYLMVDGQGRPEDGSSFQKAFQALYGVAYAIKFMSKASDSPAGFKDFKVPPPEGLWWTVHGDFATARPEDWRWKLMIRMPDFVTAEVVEKAIRQMIVKKKDRVYKLVRLDSINEGLSVQIMHIGPYEQEAATIAQMDGLVNRRGFHYIGKHHEIYFGDPRRTKPEKLRTILRHPVSS